MDIRGAASLCCSSASSSSGCRQAHASANNVGSDAPGPSAQPTVIDAELSAVGAREVNELEGGGVLQLIPSLISRAMSGALTGVFAFAGAVTGAVSGALEGRATESGLLRGAGLGAVAGAVLSVEVLKASRAVGYSNQFGHGSPSSLMDFIVELLHGRLVRDQFSPAMFNARRWQISMADVGHDENYDIFGEISPRGLSSAALKKLPCHVIREDSSCLGGKSLCSICLQEMEAGDTARSLPTCSHTFHVVCVDKWLFKHPSCPICRHRLL